MYYNNYYFSGGTYYYPSYNLNFSRGYYPRVVSYNFWNAPRFLRTLVLSGSLAAKSVADKIKDIPRKYQEGAMRAGEYIARTLPKVASGTLAVRDAYNKAAESPAGEFLGNTVGNLSALETVRKEIAPQVFSPNTDWEKVGKSSGIAALKGTVAHVLPTVLGYLGGGSGGAIAGNAISFFPEVRDATESLISPYLTGMERVKYGSQ